jgi:hypothetical protein
MLPFQKGSMSRAYLPSTGFQGKQELRAVRNEQQSQNNKRLAAGRQPRKNLLSRAPLQATSGSLRFAASTCVATCYQTQPDFNTLRETSGKDRLNAGGDKQDGAQSLRVQPAGIDVWGVKAST